MADAEIKVVGLSSSKNKKANWKVISAIVGIVVLAVGVVAGIFLVRQQQDVREKAQGNCANPESIVQCPRSDGALVSCNPPDEGNNAQISLCNVAGRVELCGVGSNVREYCCPVAGGSWTTNMSACTCNVTSPTNLTVENITATSVKLKWTPGNAVKTRIWVSKNSDPVANCAAGGAANCIVNDEDVPIATAEYEVAGLTADTKYYWKLMSWTREGCDSASQVMNFTTSTGGTASATATATSTATVTSTATATATATATSTSAAKTVTSTSTAKATATASGASSTKTPTTKPSGTATAFPVPETGVNIPTLFGVGAGAVLILISLALIF